MGDLNIKVLQNTQINLISKNTRILLISFNVHQNMQMVEVKCPTGRSWGKNFTAKRYLLKHFFYCWPATRTTNLKTNIVGNVDAVPWKHFFSIFCLFYFILFLHFSGIEKENRMNEEELRGKCMESRRLRVGKLR